jgi:hypothetical protein
MNDHALKRLHILTLPEVCEDDQWYWLSLRKGKKTITQPALCMNDEGFGFDLGHYSRRGDRPDLVIRNGVPFIGEWELIDVCDMPLPERLSMVWEPEGEE